jgi:hypothetical protein
MGLTLDTFDFTQVPPSEDALRAHLREWVGNDHGLDGFQLAQQPATYRGASHRTELLCMLDPFTRPYACAYLVSNGGIPVNRRTGERRELELPAFVNRPWHQWPWWQRLRFRLRSGPA